MEDTESKEINPQTPTESSNNFIRLWGTTLRSNFFSFVAGGNFVLTASKLAEGKTEEALGHGLFAGLSLLAAGMGGIDVQREARRLIRQVHPSDKKYLRK